MNKIEQAYDNLKNRIAATVVNAGRDGAFMHELESCIGLHESRELREQLNLTFASDVAKHVIGKMVLEGTIIKNPSTSMRYILNPDRHQTNNSSLNPTERQDYEARIAKLEEQVKFLMKLAGVPGHN